MTKKKKGWIINNHDLKRIDVTFQSHILADIVESPDQNKNEWSIDYYKKDVLDLSLLQEAVNV